MKRLLSILILLCTFGLCRAQSDEGPVVPLTERVFMTTERNICRLGDWLNVRGVVLSTDYNDFAPYSRYVNVELIGSMTDREGQEHADSVIVRQKVRTDERGYFFLTLPTDACQKEGRHYLRAYTRFMRNQPVQTFPMTSVLLTYDARRMQAGEGGGCVVSFFPEAGRLMVGTQQRIVAYVTDDYGNPVEGATLAWIAGGDTLATAISRPSGYAALTPSVAIGGEANAYVSIAKDKQQMKADLPEATEAAPFIRTSVVAGKLRLQIVNRHLLSADSRLYGFMGGFGMTEYPVPNDEGMLTMDTREMPDGLMSFWLTDGCLPPGDSLSDRRGQGERPGGCATSVPNIICQCSVWIGNVSNQAPSEPPSPTPSPREEEGSIVIRHLVSDEHHAPRAFEMLNLFNLRSDAPFPRTFYSESEREARTDLDLWLATSHFAGFDLADALAGRFDYPLAPERALTLSGQALTPDGRPLKSGNVEILNLATLDSYFCPIGEDGRYEQAVADFTTGMQFFIESVNAGGKNNRYGATLEEEQPAMMCNWMRQTDEASAHFGKQAKAVVSAIAGGIDLGEAVVTARTGNRPDWHSSQMEGVYVFSHETLQKPCFVDVESVLRRSGWVDIRMRDTSNPAPNYMSELAQMNPYMAAQNGESNKMAVNKVCFYRSDRAQKQSLMEGGGEWMNFLLNDQLITHNFEDVLSMSVDGIESIEIVKPTLSDPRLIRNHSMNGLVIIRSRHLMKTKDIPSRGITVEPAGLTLPQLPDVPHSSPQSGELKGAGGGLHPAAGQRIAVDVITPDRQIFSFEE